MDKKFERVGDWVCREERKLVLCSGSLLIVPFDKIYERDSLEVYNAFKIVRNCYASRVEIVAHYLNYFLEFYDTDHELIGKYLKIKFLIDNKKQFKKLTDKAFIKRIYSEIFTEKMIGLVRQFVNDNMYVMVDEEKANKYDPNTVCTDEDCKAILCISMGMKMLVPVLFHYLAERKKSKTKDLNRYYEYLFELFPSKDSDVYEKLWNNVQLRVSANELPNISMWADKELKGMTPTSYSIHLLNTIIISECLFRCHFESSPVSFITGIMKTQLDIVHRNKYDRDLKERRMKDGTEDGLSALDVYELNSTKIDETDVILSEINVENLMIKVEKSLENLGVTQEEIDYYREHHTPSSLHVMIVFYAYVRQFGCFRDLYQVVRSEYYKLMILLKKRLLMKKNEVLPYLISGNIESKINTRNIRNSKFLSKLDDSNVYQNLKDKFYKVLDELGKAGVENLISTLINTSFSYVEYNNQELTGEPIDTRKQYDAISNEVLNFTNEI